MSIAQEKAIQDLQADQVRIQHRCMDLEAKLDLLRIEFETLRSGLKQNAANAKR